MELQSTRAGIRLHERVYGNVLPKDLTSLRTEVATYILGRKPTIDEINALIENGRHDNGMSYRNVEHGKGTSLEHFKGYGRRGTIMYFISQEEARVETV